MADFRKWILVLAVVALFASLASAQSSSSINCQTSGGVPLIVRAEGTAELTGDVVLTCTGGVGVSPFLINYQIFLNTDITSRLLSGTTTEALLLVDEPTAATAVIGTNAFRGQIGAGGNNLQWNGVPFNPPGTTGTRVFRFTNIRANATKIPSAGIPNPITAYISVSSPTAITLTSNQVNVAVPQPSYKFSIVGSAFALQCIAPNFTEGNPYSYQLRFQELFASAFRPQIATGQDGSTQPPSTTFNSESGYVNTAVLGSGTGLASNGTRFLVWFTNPQNGVTISVTNTEVSPSDATLQASFVPTADINGAGGTPNAHVGSMNALSLNSNGNAYATWEVLASNSSVPESAYFGVQYNYTPNLPNIPALGTSGVQGNLAPAYALPTGTSASSTLPVPRFALNSTGGDTFTINPCVTDLLFPFVASTADYDTGIVVANTTQDPFSTNNQTGGCTLWYYGDGAPPSQTSTAVPAGSLLAFSLQNGGSNGVAGVGFFTGYMIIQCRFQYAHGYANISDPGLNKWASGYMALILDQGSSITRKGNTTNGFPGMVIRETLTH